MAEVWEVEPESLTDAALAAHVRELDAERCRVEAAMAQGGGRGRRRGVWDYDGATSGAAWLAYRCELSRSSAATMVRTARRLRSMPGTDAALVERRARASRRRCCSRRPRIAATRPSAVFARDEAMLVEHACRLTVDQTALMLRHWLVQADPDREKRERAEGDRLHVSSTFDGTTVLDGVYTSEDGAVIKTAVDAEYERLRRAERASGGPTRTAAQRRAAALAEVVRRAVGAEPGRPTISVTIGLDDLVDATGCGHVDDTGEPVLAETVRRLACDARIIPVVLGGTSEPIDVGRAARAVTPAQRRALTLRDRGCVFPGCDRPPGWCDGHHIVHWADGGPTDMANLALLCNHHHTALHEGGWTMARAPDTTLTFTRPDGTPLLAMPLAS